ncbi:hypothetical protein HAX54_009464 [Datura stramonium]|uniref:Uncharacterized protein n=1 Tax=Datura stramonium TaxID=4076 RepID=A0ABS8TGF6_DATST|nr:hypothetical protein [Datura stramonium]
MKPRLSEQTVARRNGPWFINVVTYLECPVSKSNQQAIRTGCRLLTRVVEIAKRRKLHDESKSDSSSGSEVHYNITSSDKSTVVTTRSKSKAQQVVAATTSLPQSDEGSDEAESDGDNPPTDNAWNGNYDAEESGDDDTNAEEFDDKESATEESNEQVEDSETSTTPKGIRKLRTEDQVLHFQWMDNIIAKDKEGAEWVTSRKSIYKDSMNFLAKSWWSIVRHRFAPTVNDNVLSADRQRWWHALCLSTC